MNINVRWVSTQRFKFIEMSIASLSNVSSQNLQRANDLIGVVANCLAFPRRFRSSMPAQDYVNHRYLRAQRVLYF